jgi:hypothetical protein
MMAYREVAPSFPALVLALMPKYGGRKSWDWKPVHVGKRLKELALPLPDIELFVPLDPSVLSGRSRLRSLSPSAQWEESSSGLPARAIYDDEGYCIKSLGKITRDEETKMVESVDWLKMEPESEDDTMLG